ncbi:MAG TPA: efflux transporter outer membrane subunit [Nitrospiria bacterium]|nr:efflux transporter outer membrane subunit [Nitrospiria bacterium]
MKRPLRLIHSVSLVVIGLALIGCEVGPNFRRPEPPTTKDYTPRAMPEKTSATSGIAGEAQRFLSGQDIPDQWWTLFHSKELDQVIRQGLADSPTLVVAQATLREAQENLRALVGEVAFPAVDGNVSAQRQKISGASFGQPNAPGNLFNLYNASVSVSYALDLFGGGRRELEALRSQVDFQSYQLEGAHLTLTSNIITTAIQEASLRDQIRTTQEMVTSMEKQVGLVERQFLLGGASRSDLLAQQTQLAQTRATLPPLELNLAQTRHRLAVLVGQLPSEAVLPEFQLQSLQLPEDLPVSLPSSLVRQRPDVLASEAVLHQASAQIGVATAAMFPQITLSGNYGSETSGVHNLFTAGTSVWRIGAGLLQPLFHGGQLSAQRRAAIAAYDQAAAQYRETVLEAFQNVADVLRALELDADLLKAQAEAEASARESLDMTQKQFELGAVNFLSLLDAQRQQRLAQVILIQAQARRYSDTVALFQALGGGWWNRDGKIKAD